ncbi:CYTH domain-containing protein [Shewanella youngdeokensis]|uniref:CYTH domain-containing protein n=1 Tax=Shewanella youngdeokensis TaxID=2999068 RepID=A0ABZ0JWM2_9GAMM|nr:CYTH domain-containing protein [Shewanella sp. DAU334]
MEAEIELKLFFNEKEIKNLINLLDNVNGADAKGSEKLTNGYFETPELTLRQWDMGLRVRGINNHREQTIKTAGQVIGGIHSRPEFNVDIDHDFPKLNLFPDKIWPQGVDLELVQSQLRCLFHTDFERQKWHIFVEDSLVEVALDVGRIHVDERSEPICELEFELLAGDTSALLVLASTVSQQIPVRLGKASKALRGYQLAAQASPFNLEVLEFIALKPEQNLTQVAINLLEVGLDRWQQLEAMILDVTINSHELPMLCYRLRACIRLLKSTLAQFNLLATRFEQDFDRIETRLNFIEESLSLFSIVEKGGALISKLPMASALIDIANDKLEQLDISNQFEQLLDDICYGRLQVHLVDLLMQITQGVVVIDKSLELQTFADTLQENSWQKILDVMPIDDDLSSRDYLTVAKALDDSMFVGVAYGELYSDKARDQFRAPWQDLAMGIRTLAAYRQLKEISEIAYVDISQWLENKEQSLVQAMEFSRRRAMQNEPYWR